MFPQNRLPSEEKLFLVTKFFSFPLSYRNQIGLIHEKNLNWIIPRSVSTEFTRSVAYQLALALQRALLLACL